MALTVDQAGAGRLETVGCEEPADCDSVDVSALTTTLDWCFADGVVLASAKGTKSPRDKVRFEYSTTRIASLSLSTRAA
jgi:hypothetical protein